MSKIDRVEVYEFQYTLQNVGPDGGKGFNTGYCPGGKLPVTNYAITISTDDGLQGEYVSRAPKTPSLAQVRIMAPFLIGRDPYAREEIYNDMKVALRQYDHMGYGMIDIALWDLAGKATGQPLCEMLGIYRKKLPAYASTIHADTHGSLSTPQDYLTFAQHCYALGYQGFKMHGWSSGHVKHEVEAVRLLGREFEGKMKLMTDPCCALRTFAEALEVGRACDEVGFFWLEDPMMDSGISHHAHRKLRHFIKTPILITEHVRGLENKADCIVAEATDFVRVDPDYDFGVTGTLKTAHLAEAFGLDVEIHGAGPCHRHCMAAIRNTNFYEMLLVSPDIPENIFPPVFSCGYQDVLESIDSEGCVEPPMGPGLGVALDWDFIHHHLLTKTVYPAL